MPHGSVATLTDRGLLAISGPDRIRFLQGLVSNDVARVSPGRAVYSTLLTPQGKFLFDFIMMEDGQRLLLDCEAQRIDDLARRLNVFRLRLKVEIAPVQDRWQVHAAFGNDVLEALGLGNEPGSMAECEGGFALVDPRLAELGARLILPESADPTRLGLSRATIAEYETLRIGLGVPDGSRDMVVGKTVLLEAGLDRLNGIDWDKGCYMGQELTARTRYRGLVRRRLLPVDVDGNLPDAGTPITLDGRDAGEVRSGQGQRALAMIRLNLLTGEEDPPLMAGDARLHPCRPDWAEIPC